MIAKLRVLTVLLVMLIATSCSHLETSKTLQEFQIKRGEQLIASYLVEIASDTASRKRGLMFRETLEPSQAMLLSYKYKGVMAIWMKNTFIPLDILFIDTDGVIVKIHEGAEPLSTKRILSEKKVQSVLEINAGQVKEYAIVEGDRLVRSATQKVSAK